MVKNYIFQTYLQRPNKITLSYMRSFTRTFTHLIPDTNSLTRVRARLHIHPIAHSLTRALARPRAHAYSSIRQSARARTHTLAHSLPVRAYARTHRSRQRTRSHTALAHSSYIHIFTYSHSPIRSHFANWRIPGTLPHKVVRMLHCLLFLQVGRVDL